MISCSADTSDQMCVGIQQQDLFDHIELCHFLILLPCMCFISCEQFYLFLTVQSYWLLMMSYF